MYLSLIIIIRSFVMLPSSGNSMSMQKRNRILLKNFLILCRENSHIELAKQFCETDPDLIEKFGFFAPGKGCLTPISSSVLGLYAQILYDMVGYILFYKLFKINNN